jgi:putative cardiolipin synthase
VTFVGSFNLDPRSASLNRKMGVFLEDRALAGHVWEEHHRLTWRGQVEGHMRVFRADPDTTLLRRLLAGVIGWLPSEPQL